ncbi:MULTISPECIES: hypothetical protein [unclassified Blastococcus]
MTRRRPARPVAPLLAALLAVPATACGTEDGGDAARAAAPAAAAATPETAEELAALLVTEVPSGLARVPDADVDPPAGEKSIEDVAGYADDPDYERGVLEDYGYRYGWERFWGTPGGTVTSVFVDQFADAAGAAAYAGDLAADGADFYAGLLRHDPAQLPEGCRLLTVERPDPGSRVTGPAAFAWCSSGVFSVAVSAVAGTVQAATDEVTALVPEQLDRLAG